MIKIKKIIYWQQISILLLKMVARQNKFLYKSWKNVKKHAFFIGNTASTSGLQFPTW